MPIEICACVAGAKASPASNAVVESSVLSPRISDPLKVSAVGFVAWDAVCSRREQSSNSSYHKDFSCMREPTVIPGQSLFIPTFLTLEVRFTRV
jgi:hypothetical protein